MNEKKPLQSFDVFKLLVGIVVGLWLMGVAAWMITGQVFYVFGFFISGLILGVGAGVYNRLPRERKPWGRRLFQLLAGSYMLVFLGLAQSENMQIEGFFSYLLAGLFGAAVIHYLVFKLLGPLVIGRVWCGWSCWTAMILDLLPFKQNKRGRLAGNWEIWRYVHFFASLSLIVILWVGLDYRVDAHSSNELAWLVGGNLLYYALAIGLAYALEDNRAFCKYACPIPALQKLAGRFALLKIEANPTRCNDCGLCAHRCPMDIRIPAYTRQGLRVLSSECILCMECVYACGENALELTAQLDYGPDLVRAREPGAR